MVNDWVNRCRKNGPAPLSGRFVKASSGLLAFLALESWFGFIGLFLHYDVTRPTVRQPNAGKVYPSNNHGHVVYLSEQDEHRLNLLQGVALSLFVIAVMLDYAHRHQIAASQIHKFLISSLRWLCSPASWLASLRKLRQQNVESQSKNETGRHIGDYKRQENRISFRTGKSISECQKMVKSVGYSAFGIVLERFDGYNFCLSVQRNYRNSFAPICTGELIPEVNGTVVDIQFGMRPFVRIFLAVWFIGVSTIGSVIFSKVLSGSYVQTAEGIVVPLALLGFGILLMRFGNRLGQDEQSYILGWLDRSFGERTQKRDSINQSSS